MMPVELRFWSKVKFLKGCWEWQACKNKDGYGVFSFGSRPIEAHRIALLLSKGLPLTATNHKNHTDHVCRNHSCVNPEHLEIVSSRENVKRGNTHAAKTHCINGHNLSHARVKTDWQGTRRICQICNRIAVAKYKRSKQ